MSFAAVFRILGILLLLFALTQLPPALIGWIFNDVGKYLFLILFALNFLLGLLIWYPLRHQQSELRSNDGFFIVVFLWVALSVLAAIPFLFVGNMSLVDALFEAISGITTTGATSIADLEQVAHSLLFYRQQLQWLGGMGIIILAVAVLPLLNISANELYRCEMSSVKKDDKISPRIAQTAKVLWGLYLGLTVACAIVYFLLGMDWFDAICHSFGTIALGGFSTHNASIGHFDNPMIELAAAFFILLAGMNFASHFFAFRSRDLSVYFKDEEWRFYIFIIFSVIVITILSLYFKGIYTSFFDAVRYGGFQAVSVLTTTGYTNGGFVAWGFAIPVVLFGLSMIGGCAGSTGGGIKVIRTLLIVKQGFNEILRSSHPNGVFTISIRSQLVEQRVLLSVYGFIALYMLLYTAGFMSLLFFDLDLLTAFSATAAALNNLGVGLGDVGAHYGDMPSGVKVILMTLMFLGRLEIISFLVLLNPYYWRR